MTKPTSLVTILTLTKNATAFLQSPLQHPRLPKPPCNSNVRSQAIFPSIPATVNPTQLNLFGNLFGDTKSEDQQDLSENELARFTNLSSLSSSAASMKFDSLSIMIFEWSKLFVDDGTKKKMGLTTPVTVVALPQTDVDDVNVVDYTGVQLLFQKSQAAYKDKDDERNKENGTGGESDAPKKEGGVQVMVEKLSDGDLRVTASRCNIEEGSMIKEMSEQTILDSLRKAVDAWKKEQQSAR